MNDENKEEYNIQTAVPHQYCDSYSIGMTLRDYFAARALQADIEYQGLEGREDLLHVAGMAYEMADAMLKAREVK